MARTPVVRWTIRSLLGTLAACGTVLFPGALLAQACIGSPASPGQIAAGGTASFSDGRTGYGGEAVMNLLGPFSIGGAYGVVDADDSEEKITRYGLRGVYEFPSESPVSVCPSLQGEYTTTSSTFIGQHVDVNTLAIPVGMALGTTLGNPVTAQVLPNAGAGLLYQRTQHSFPATGSTVSSETGFYFNAGATIAVWHIYAGAQVSTTTLEDSNAVVTVSAGFRL